MTDDGRRQIQKTLPGLLPRLWRFALVLSRDGRLAEDLVQATCLRALERAAQFQVGSRLDHWTFAIMASIWKNQKRADAVRRGSGQVDAALADELAVAPRAEAKVMARQVLAAVGALPEGQRSAVLLVYVEGLSYREAAEALDVPMGTVMSRLATARKTLAPLRDEARRAGQGERG